jgi:hypothetical protein
LSPDAYALLPIHGVVDANLPQECLVPQSEMAFKILA